jgi:hypothetical protein
MYTAGRPHPLREPCRQALEAALHARVRLVTDTEVLQEILYRYFSIKKPLAGKTVYRATVDMCDEILPLSENAKQPNPTLPPELPPALFTLISKSLFACDSIVARQNMGRLETG